MYLQSLTSLIESAKADHSHRNASGYVDDVEALCSRESIEALEREHPGCFAFLAFRGASDAAVAEYVRGGSLAADAGPHVLALFTVATAVATPRRVAGVILDDGTQPSYDFARRLFPDGAKLVFPGVVIVRRFSGEDEPVFVSVATAMTAAEVKALLEETFGRAASSWLATREHAGSDFTTRFCAALALAGIAYERGGTTSIFEWIAALLRWAGKNASTVVSAAKLFG